MDLPDLLAFVIVTFTGLYLAGLGVLSIADAWRAARFLGSFAGSARAHYIELVIRLIVGLAFIRLAPHMPFSSGFAVFGWILLVTTVCLFAVPWRWHHRFAQKSVPHAVRHLKLFGAVSFALGVFVIACSFAGAGH